MSRFNEEVLDGKYVAEPERVTFINDGVEIDGWILKPMDYDPTNPIPAS